MPEMDGLQTLAELRKTYAQLPVIMFSTLTRRGAAETLDALALGANDYMPKPTSVSSADLAMQHIRKELIPKIQALCAPGLGLDTPGIAPRPIAPLPSRLPAEPERPSGVDVVAIAVSTGGPNSLSVLLPALPADCPVPVLIVQHMPPVFTKLLAERLDACTSLRVEEGRPGEMLEPGSVWIAPGGYHLTLERDGSAVRLQTNLEPAENSCRPAADVLFRSVVAVYGANMLAVVLTGMGQDGLRGCEQIHQVGGQILAQDEATSVVWGMPGFVATAGLAHKVLPLQEIGPEIVRQVARGRTRLATTIAK